MWLMSSLLRDYELLKMTNILYCSENALRGRASAMQEWAEASCVWTSALPAGWPQAPATARSSSPATPTRAPASDRLLPQLLLRHKPTTAGFQHHTPGSGDTRDTRSASRARPDRMAAQWTGRARGMRPKARARRSAATCSHSSPTLCRLLVAKAKRGSVTLRYRRLHTSRSRLHNLRYYRRSSSQPLHEQQGQSIERHLQTRLDDHHLLHRTPTMRHRCRVETRATGSRSSWTAACVSTSSHCAPSSLVSASSSASQACDMHISWHHEIHDSWVFVMQPQRAQKRIRFSVPLLCGWGKRACVDYYLWCIVSYSRIIKNNWKILVLLYTESVDDSPLHCKRWVELQIDRP